MEPRRSRRRVPDQLRKRTQLSCDLCRKRRSKCIRQGANEDCLACQRNNVQCLSTFRRKTRLYGSFETISDRVRSLEAVVRGAFPNEPINTVSEIQRIGKRMGYPMPEPSSTSLDAETYPIGRSAHQQSAEAEPNPSFSDQRPSGVHHSVQTDRNDAPSRPWQTHHLPDQGAETSRMVQDRSGHTHYIGPSGSLTFFAELRDLIFERQPSSRFASDNVAQALEARPETQTASRPGETESTHLCGRAAESSPISESISSELSRSVSRLKDIRFDVIEKLLHLYFSHVNPDFPLFHRTTFQDQLEQYLRHADYRHRLHHETMRDDRNREPDEGWIVSVHMMLTFGCVLASNSDWSHRAVTDDFDLQALRSECWNASRTAVPHLVTSCTLSNVQALLLIGLYHHSINERNAAWTLVGTAARMSIAMGLHRNDVNFGFRMVERETRKNLWYTLYSFEQFLCMSLGRPSAIDDQEVNVSPPSEDVMGTGYGTPGCMAQSFQLQLASSKLRRILSFRSLSFTRAHQMEPTLPPSKLHPRGLMKELQTFYDSLPSHLVLPDITFGDNTQFRSQLRDCVARYSPSHLRSIVVLHLQFSNLKILITRPYLLMVISTSFRQPSSTPYLWNCEDRGQEQLDDVAVMARSCVASASRIATLILLLEHAGVLNGLTSLDVFYAYSASMVLLLRRLFITDPASVPNVLHAEETLWYSAQALASEVRRTLAAIPKCPTMQRFVSVVENFADIIPDEGPRALRVDDDNAGPTGASEEGSESIAASGARTAQSSQAHDNDLAGVSTLLPGGPYSVERPLSNVRNEPLGSAQPASNTTTNNLAAPVPSSAPEYSGGFVGGYGANNVPNHSCPPASYDSNIATRALRADSSSFSHDPSYNGIFTSHQEAYRQPQNTYGETEFISGDMGSSIALQEWQDPLQSAVQHLQDWQEFELFLGSLGEG